MRGPRAYAVASAWSFRSGSKVCVHGLISRTLSFYNVRKKSPKQHELHIVVTSLEGSLIEIKRLYPVISEYGHDNGAAATILQQRQ